MTEPIWKKEYPFEERYFTIPSGERLHYVDEGQGVPVVMCHGNPTWSFMYRKAISALAAQGHRAIAIDHIGCGLSDKPQEPRHYTLARHIRNLEYLIDDVLKLDQLDLILHDWGGAIGMGYAARHPQKIRRIILMNTAAYCSKVCPWQIALCRIPFIGAFLVRGCNLFAGSAIYLASARGLSAAAREGLLYPYRNWKDRVAIYRFVRDIPMSHNHISRAVLEGIEEALPSLSDKPVMLCWGERDFCFTMKYFERWKQIYPHAQAHSFPEAGHYLLEDASEQLLPRIIAFLS